MNAPRGGLLTLQQNTAHDEQSDTEIDDQSGHVDQRCDKWGGRGCGISTDSAQDEGKHGSGERAPEDHTDEGYTDCERNERPMRAIRLSMQILFTNNCPRPDTHNTDRPEDSP